MALARFLYNEGNIEGALVEIKNALKLAPYYWEARRFRKEILLAHGKEEEALTDYGELIEHLNMTYLRFQCKQCGFEPADLQWQCPQCKAWDTTQLIEATGARSPASSQVKDVLFHMSGEAGQKS